MSLRYTVLSLVACFIVLLLALKNYETWTQPVEVVPEKGTTKRSGVKAEVPSPVGVQKETGSVASYVLISEKNIFSPDRKEFPIVTAATDPSKEVKKPIVRPQVTLYGVTISESYQSASISYPSRVLQRGERAIMTARIGDRIADYKLAKIMPDRIVLEAPEDSFEVLLNDSRNPKNRVVVKTENRPAMVTSTLPAPAASVAPGAPKPGEPVAGRIAEVPVPRPVTPAPIPYNTRSRQRLPVGAAPR